AGRRAMGRGDRATWAAAVGGDRVSVPARATAAGDVSFQARPDPGRRLSVAAAEHTPAVSPAHRAGPGGPVPRDSRDPAGTARASLHRGGPERTGRSLLAAGRPARRR